MSCSGLQSVIAGAAAMLSKKGRGRHSNLGTIYFWCLFGVFVTMSALSFMRWAANYHLFILGALSFASAYFGRTAARRHWRQWPRLHLTGMGASYIVMLTAFYVDNGKNLPLWKELPQIAFWFLPGADRNTADPSCPFLAPAGSGLRSLGSEYRQIQAETQPLLVRWQFCDDLRKARAGIGICVRQHAVLRR